MCCWVKLVICTIVSIRLPTKLYVHDLDENVIKVDALEDFEDKNAFSGIEQK